VNDSSSLNQQAADNSGTTTIRRFDKSGFKTKSTKKNSPRGLSDVNTPID
jgi:hypothetical protein